MPHKKVMLITWPDSQACCNCLHGSLVVSKNSAYQKGGYVCFKNKRPDGKTGEDACSFWKHEGY